MHLTNVVIVLTLSITFFIELSAALNATENRVEKCTEQITNFSFKINNLFNSSHVDILGGSIPQHILLRDRRIQWNLSDFR